MVQKSDLDRIDEYRWMIPTSFREDMRVPVQIFASDTLIDQALDDKSMHQAVNTATLPGLVERVVVMPDVHQGYGFPIGGVAASRYPEGIISPGAIGYDINCGVRLLSSRITLEQARPWMDDLASALYANCPSGVGVGGSVHLTVKQLENVCREGSGWALNNGYAQKEDLERTEEQGKIEGALPGKVSERAKKRGKGQLGTL
ncbi:MAG: RtcB family protein, partial [Anaerolineales bacterium]